MFSTHSNNKAKLKTLHSIKCVTVGGKSDKQAIMHAYKLGRSLNDSDYIPYVFDDYHFPVAVEGKIYKMAIWDTCDEGAYENLRVLSYPETNVFLIFFSVTDRQSFNKVTQVWIPEIKQHCPDAPCILVATSIDVRNNTR